MPIDTPPIEIHPSARNLILCCDGTNNEFGTENTNVIRLIQVLDRDPRRQRLYYDPGVGTLPEPGVWTALGKKISQWLGLAFGLGLSDNILQAYTFLMETWEPGDRVFLFGFSRGAYTVRVLAGLLHSLGLLPRGSQSMVPYLMRLFKAVRSDKSYWQLCDDFRWTFARPGPGGRDDRRFRVHYLGLWDTVSSVGWVYNPKTFPFTTHNPSVEIIRHAVAIDERRAFFRQNLMYADPPSQDLKQYWFPGVHSDVGGGYKETEGGLWRIPFQWILDEAQKTGLLVDPGRLHKVLYKTPPPERPWAEPLNVSLTPGWWPVEFLPKAKSKFPWLWCNRGHHRFILKGELLDQSTLLRIRATDYAPPNFTPAFLAKIRALHEVPETLAFEW